MYIILQKSGNGLPVWKRTTSQGLSWWKAQISWSSDPSDPITNFVLEGVVGSGTKGDIAVDDISVTSGPCSK